MARRIGVIFLSLGIVWFVALSVRALYYNPTEEAPVSKEIGAYSANLSSTTAPVRLVIPKINVDAKIEQVGITFKGNMSTPKKIKSTGWYKYGTIPGENGSSVIDGHVDNGFGLPGVFTDLKKLSIGDDVYVYTISNEKIQFRVIDIQTYYYTEVPRTLLFNKNGGIYLNLITCEGQWIPEEETDDHRIVVYTERV